MDFAAFCKDIPSILLEKKKDGPTKHDLKELFGALDLDQDGLLSFDKEYTRYLNLADRLYQKNTALIVVDFQNDFVNGSLSIKDGPAGEDPLEVLPALNALVKRYNPSVHPLSCFEAMVYTFDWHPENHISFFENRNDGDRQLSKEDETKNLNVFDKVQFVKPVKLVQTLYPKHCIQDTPGAELHSKLQFIDHPAVLTVQKGMETFKEVYSAFGGTVLESGETLEGELKDLLIDILFVCGLATDICVAATVRDALKLGFEFVAIVTDCSAGLDKKAIEGCFEEFRNQNVALMDSNDVKAFVDLESRRCPFEWIKQMAKLQLEEEERSAAIKA